MEILIISVRFLAVSQVVLFLIAIMLSPNPLRVRLTGSILVAGILGFLLGPLFLEELGLPYASAVWTLAGVVPSMMLLLAWIVFEDRTVVPLWLMTIVVLDVVFETVTHIVYVQTANHDGLLMELLPFKRIALTLSVLFLIWRGRDCDLVELRMKLRWWIIFSIAALVLLVDFSNIVASYKAPPWFELFSLVATFVLCLIVNLAFLKLNPSFKFLDDERKTDNEVIDPDVAQLLERMQGERLYADHDLRVGTLAEMVGLPEYQLRKKINQNLGYRNFNQFVNRYRVEEAGKRLHTQPRLPVLSVAMDVGFRSISSFNTAFQSHFGVSPTVYRKQASE